MCPGMEGFHVRLKQAEVSCTSELTHWIEAPQALA
jgi:hypothetical protein